MTVVEFKSVDDFLAELREEATNIADKVVRWEVNVIPEQKEGVTFQVDYWVTALRKGGDDDQLLELGLVAGRNTDEHLEGTQNAGIVKKKVAEVCDDLGLKLRPGKIEVY